MSQIQYTLQATDGRTAVAAWIAAMPEDVRLAGGELCRMCRVMRKVGKASFGDWIEARGGSRAWAYHGLTYRAVAN